MTGLTFWKVLDSWMEADWQELVIEFWVHCHGFVKT